jgi:hypothetical protein
LAESAAKLETTGKRACLISKTLCTPPHFQNENVHPATGINKGWRKLPRRTAYIHKSTTLNTFKSVKIMNSSRQISFLLMVRQSSPRGAR